jgi:hypothetical protein
MDKDVLVQYYCVLVDKYIGLREPVIINTHKIDAMLVRGLTIKRGFNYLTQEVCNLQKD